eukprot:gene35804-46463_t
MDQLSVKVPWITFFCVPSGSNHPLTEKSPLRLDNNLLKMKMKWRLKNDVMATPSTKSQSPSDRSHTTHDPALGLANYSRFTSAVKNSNQLNPPCIPPFRKRQPWMNLELTQLCLEYSQSRVRFLSAQNTTNRDFMSNLARRLSEMNTVEQEQFLHSICNEIDSLTGDTQTRLPTGLKSRSNDIVTAEDNIDRLKLWHGFSVILEVGLSALAVIKPLVYSQYLLYLQDCSNRVAHLPIDTSIQERQPTLPCVQTTVVSPLCLGLDSSVYREQPPPYDVPIEIVDATASCGMRSRPSLDFVFNTRTWCTSPALYDVSDLDFADDIAALSSSDVQIMILSIAQSCSYCSLLFTSQPCQNFKYLGTWLLSSLNDFKARLAAAWSAIKRLNRIWTSTAISTSLNLRLFNSLVCINPFAGHCYLSFESAPNVLFFSLKGTRKQLSEAPEMHLDEISLQNAMLDRDFWKRLQDDSIYI